MAQFLFVIQEAYAEDPIPGKYIVVFKDQDLSESGIAMLASGETVRQAAERLLSEARQNQLYLNNRRGISNAKSQESIGLGFVYGNAIKGFSASLTPDAVNLLRQNPDIAYIEPDREVKLHAVQTPTPSWGLDRIDQRNLPLNQAYEYLNDGSGVHAYVIDSGIRATHNEFSGRVGNGFDFIDNDTIPNDCNGHGTHVAGTLGGTNFGVAKNVTIHPVRVFGCGNTTPTSTIIAGINWVSANRQLPAVANMSLGGPALTALDTAVVNLINSGVVAVVSAGNDNGANACNSSPARVANALTVASSTMTDQRSGFSNIGNCIDIFAPGSAIVSAWITSNTASNTLNGTSMAAPHVSGVAALRLDVQPSQTPAQVNTAIINSATTNRISNPGSGTPNRLLFSGSGSSSSSSSSSSSGGSCPASGTFVTSACSSGVVGAAQTAASTCCNGYYSVPQGGYSCYAFYCN